MITSQRPELGREINNYSVTLARLGLFIAQCLSFGTQCAFESPVLSGRHAFDAVRLLSLSKSPAIDLAAIEAPVRTDPKGRYFLRFEESIESGSVDPQVPGDFTNRHDIVVCHVARKSTLPLRRPGIRNR
jgi:hypothetical protein